MNTILKYAAICVTGGVLALATSCTKFLDPSPKTQLPGAAVYGDIDKVRSIVDGLYDSNLHAFRASEHQRTLLGTDELRWTYDKYVNGGSMASYDDYALGLNGNTENLATPWELYWNVVATAGEVIYYCKDGTTDQARSLVAQSRFLRGVNMFKLAVLYGDIPIIDIDYSAANGYYRQPQDVVWKFIIDDFRLAAEALPDVATDYARANKWAALAMLGKSLMQAPVGVRDFAAADECFTKIIASGKFDLVPKYRDLWNNTLFEYPTIPSTTAVGPEVVPSFQSGGKSESLFTLAFKILPGNNSTYGNIYGWLFGCAEFGAWFNKGQANWLAGYDAILPNTFMYEDVNEVAEYYDYEKPEPSGPVKRDKGPGIWEDGDTRRDASIRYEWRYYTNLYEKQPPVGAALDGFRKDGSPFQWIEVNERKIRLRDNESDALNPHVKKFEDARCDMPTSGTGWDIWVAHKPYPMIRYSDILLLHAECLSEMDRGGQGAAFVKQVRDRAWGGTSPTWSASDKDDFRRKIMDERMRELCFEGWRRADLIRTGLFTELVSTRNDWAKKNPGFVNVNKEHWPIPITDVIQNANLYKWVQNPGYAE